MPPISAPKKACFPTFFGSLECALLLLHLLRRLYLKRYISESCPYHPGRFILLYCNLADTIDVVVLRMQTPRSSARGAPC